MRKCHSFLTFRSIIVDDSSSILNVYQPFCAPRVGIFQYAGIEHTQIEIDEFLCLCKPLRLFLSESGGIGGLLLELTYYVFSIVNENASSNLSASHMGCRYTSETSPNTKYPMCALAKAHTKDTYTLIDTSHTSNCTTKCIPADGIWSR